MIDISERFLRVIAERHAKRAFLVRPVPVAALERVLTAAGHAPSTRNNQPWQVSVVTGAAREALVARLWAEFDGGVPAHPDYRNRLPGPNPVAEERARDANVGVLRAFGEAEVNRAAGDRKSVV